MPVPNDYLALGTFYDKQYTDLIQYAAQQCTAFSFTKFKGIRYLSTAEQMENTLKPYKNNDFLGLGTVGNYQKGSKVYQYVINKDTLQFLRQCNGLFEWESPTWLEDLTFYICDDYWMRSISHEKLVFFNPKFMKQNIWVKENIGIQIPQIDKNE